MDQSQILFSVIAVTAIILFVSEKLRVDVIAVMIILALSITGLLDVKEAFSGFASEPAIIVAAVFILSAGLSATGVTAQIGQTIGQWAGNSESRAMIVIMSGVALLSAFTHHLMVTALMLPIVLKICKEKGLAPSRLLIPMATSASLGTTLTLIGAPAFLLANSILVRSGETPLSFFSPALVGLPLVIASFLMIVVLKWALPKRAGKDDSDERFKIGDLYTELVIPKDSRWIGQTFGELKTDTEKRFKIVDWFRGNRIRGEREMDESSRLREGDVFLIQTTSDELLSIDEKMGLALRALQKYGDELSEHPGSLTDQQSRILQAVIAPQSPFIGRSIGKINFLGRYGVIVIGIWRKSGWIYDKISEVELQEGDLVVLWGPEEHFETIARHDGFLMLLPMNARPVRRVKSKIALGIMAASVAVAAFGLLPPHVAFVAGALLMVLTHCVNPSQAYESVETKIFVMIAGVIPLGMAMEQTGVDKFLAAQLTHYVAAFSPFLILMIFFWISALLTQILSDAATTVLLAPIAVAFAKTSAVLSPTAGVVVITMGAIASFLTPIGHHGNLLILSPGGYRFVDFFKIGLPVTIVISLLTVWLSLMHWPG